MLPGQGSILLSHRLSERAPETLARCPATPDGALDSPAAASNKPGAGLRRPALQAYDEAAYQWHRALGLLPSVLGVASCRDSMRHWQPIPLVLVADRLRPGLLLVLKTQFQPSSVGPTGPEGQIGRAVLRSLGRDRLAECHSASKPKPSDQPAARGRIATMVGGASDSHATTIRAHWPQEGRKARSDPGIGQSAA